MFSVPCLFQAVFEFVAQSLSHAPSPPPSALGPWDWDPANSVLLCQLLPVRLCQDRALGGDCKAGGRGETRSSRSATYPPDSEKGGLWARTAEGHLLLSFCPQSCLTFCEPVGCRTPGFLSLTISWSVLKLPSTGSMMPSNHLFLGRPLLLPPSGAAPASESRCLGPAV